MRIISTLIVACIVFVTIDMPTYGERVLPAGELPKDARLAPRKHLNGYFPFVVPSDRKAWEVRAAELRQRIRVATGLWPEPEKTPLNPVVFGNVRRDGFIVQKAYFESYPGHFVTGLVFRPESGKGPFPGVLSPHGHGGRQQDYGEQKLAKLIEEGAEKYTASGRYPKLARCAQLARMGCVVFIFDMLGYEDSQQISRELAHGFRKQRPDFESAESWGLFSTQAELRLQSVMGIQTWNCVRALDFLSQLPDVDNSRLAVTGGSGGGTQTILLGAMDDRPVAAFPQGMVSTSMQGGCTCENCSLLRIGTGNVELTALFAPRPQAMTAAKDWTHEMMTKGYPELKRLYSLYGVPDSVQCKPYLHFPHNYNFVTRRDMYHWFNKHLKLGLAEPIEEQDYAPLTREEWTVWDKEHPQPAGGAEYERSLTRLLADMSSQQLAAVQPSGRSDKDFRKVVGAAFDTILAGKKILAGKLKRTKVRKSDHGTYLQFADLLENDANGSQLPVVSLYPKTKDWNGKVVIWIDKNGKDGLFDGEAPQAAIQQLLDQGTAILSADLIYQGEFLRPGQTFQQTPVVANPREFAGYTFGYNHTVFAQRVHDLLTMLMFANDAEHGTIETSIVASSGMEPIVAAACTQAGELVQQCALANASFRFHDLRSYRDPSFLPGAVKYGDLPALLTLLAPRRLLLGGMKTAPELVTAGYRAHDAAARLEVQESALTSTDIVGWLPASR